MANAFNTNSLFVEEEVNKVKLKLEIPNFSDVVGKTKKGDELSSKPFLVGRSKFTLSVYPSGTMSAEQGMLSAFLHNESNQRIGKRFWVRFPGWCNFI